MSDENRNLNKKDQKRLDEGRGQGSLDTYKPFILVGEFSSSGESVRVKSHIANRVHHFHSGIEFAAFLIFAYSIKTKDIREQYPLPLIDTLNICNQLGVKHPQAKSELYIVTTDLIIDLKGGKKLAIAVKPINELSNKRTIEKLQIERSYWESRGVEWFIFTDKDISMELKQNLHWLKPFLEPESAEQYQITFEDVVALIGRLSSYDNGKVNKICGLLDDKYQQEAGTHLTILRYSMANGHIKAALNKLFHDIDISELEIEDPNTLELRIHNAS
jgi:hypothetical protein